MLVAIQKLYTRSSNSCGLPFAQRMLCTAAVNEETGERRCGETIPSEKVRTVGFWAMVRVEEQGGSVFLWEPGKGQSRVKAG